MHKIASQTALNLLISASITPIFAGEMGALSTITSGFYAGIGSGWDHTDETFNSTTRTSTMKTAYDHYTANQNRLAPIAQLGYWAPLHEKWLWGIAAQWNYLGYKTANVNSSRGQYIPNASFSSINIFGPDVLRDFSSQTRANNEVRLLAYFGEQFKNSHAYLGLGPTLFTASNSVYVSSVHVGGGDTLISSSVKDSQTLWGAAAQLGYNYYLNATYFINFSYTYAQSGTYHFKNSANTALLNGATTQGPTTVNLNRKISLVDQSIMVSINKTWG